MKIMYALANIHEINIPEVNDTAAEFYHSAEEIKKVHDTMTYPDFQYIATMYRTEALRKLHSLLKEDEFAEEQYEDILTSEQVSVYLDKLACGVLSLERAKALDDTLDYLVQKRTAECNGVLPLEEAALDMLREAMAQALANGSLRFWDSPAYRVPDIVILEENKDDEPPQEPPYENEED